MYAMQVGAAVLSLRKHASDDSYISGGFPGEQSASLKANMGHLEACAAAAGLASLLVAPPLVPSNAQL